MSKENYISPARASENPKPFIPKYPSSEAYAIATFIGYLIGCIIAFTMSYRCSSLTNRSCITKIWWAFISGLNSWWYVFLHYFILNWDTCDSKGITRAYKGCVTTGGCKIKVNNFN